MTRLTHKNIDEYIASFPESTQAVLKKIRQVIKEAEPKLTEGISYAIPVFNFNGRYLVYFAGYKNHVSVYPATTEAVQKAGLAEYKVSTGTLKFPLDKEIPYEKLAKFVKERLKEEI